MVIVCPTCNASYNISEKKLPSKKIATVCKKCDGKIIISPPSKTSQKSDTTTTANPKSVQSSPKGAPKRPTQPIRKSAVAKTPIDLLSDYPELNDYDPNKYELINIFSPNKKGGYKNYKNKFKLKVLNATKAIFDKLLASEEKILRIAKGTAYYPAELLLGNGFLTTIYNHYAIACTNQRILFVNINTRMTHTTHYIRQMRYEDIKKVKRGLLFNHLILTRFKGGRQVYTAIKRYLLKEMQNLILQRQKLVATKSTPQKGFEQICPSCFAALEEKLTQCSQCQALFKKPRTAFFKSLILPGWGDFYLGHRFLGVVEIIGSVFVWAIIVSAIFGVGSMHLILAAVILVFYNLLDGLLTLHMARKGYMLSS